MSCSLLQAGALLLSLTVAAVHLDAQVLPLVTELDGEETRFWWQEPSEPSLNLFDTALIESGRGFTDPRTAPRPAVSRSYRQPTLTALSARNLASLYGAQAVLHGEMEILRIEPVADHLFWIATVRIDCRLFDVSLDRARIEVSRTFSGAGANSEAALGEAISAAVQTLLDQMTTRDVSGQLAIPVATVPTILVRGADRASLLVALKGDLRRHEAIVADIWEAWASEGLIALEVALQPPSDEDTLVELLYQLEFDQDVSYELIVHSREDLTIPVDLTSVSPEVDPEIDLSPESP